MKKIITLKGLLIAFDRDLCTDEIISIALKADNDFTYIIADESMTYELEKYIHTFMELKGKVFENEFGDLLIKVSKYSAISKGLQI